MNDISAFPNNAAWPVHTLSALTSTIRRGTAPVYVEESSVRAIGQRCITLDGFNSDAARPHSDRAMRNVLQPAHGDVLLNSTGTGTIGRSSLFTEDSNHYIVDGHVTVVRPIPDLADGYWLNAVLATPWGQTYLETYCYSGSTNQIELSAKSLGDLPLGTPTHAEQRRIAEILRTLDKQILKTEQTIAKLTLVKQGLLHDLLSCGVDDNGELRNYVRHPEEFGDSPLGRMPRHWEVMTCAQLCVKIVVGIVIKPAQYYRDDGVPILRSANVRERGVVLDDLKFMSQADHDAMSKSAVTPGDLVTVRTGYPGTTAVVPSFLAKANCVDIIISRPGPRVDANYLALWVNSDLGKGQVLRRQGGLAQQHFNVSEMKALAVAVPPIAEQEHIAQMLQGLQRHVAAEEAKVLKLHILKQGLMEDLLTGRVRVAVEAAA